LDHLDVQDVTLAGHDWGGAIGFGWAAQNPGRVRRFVVFNTAAFFGPIPLRIRASRWPIVGTIGVRGLNVFARAAALIACKHRERMTPAVRRGYLLPYDTYANRVAVLEFVRDIPTVKSGRSRETVRRIEESLAQFRDRPMIILWGGKDFCFNDHFLDEWRRRFPSAQVHRFPDAGHYVVEDAHERILPLLTRFLDSGAQ
jgi:haloalkane dehalogenase